MIRRAIKKEWALGDPVEFKHIWDLNSRLDEQDSQIIGNIWNEMQSAQGEAKMLGARVAELERREEEMLTRCLAAEEQGRKCQARVAELEEWKRLAELERAEGLTQLDKADARVAVLEARKESAIVNMQAASDYLERVESLLGSASLMIGKVSDADALAWMDRYYMRQRISIADQSGKGGDDG